jgi:DNA-binding Lrp family transcriptional regulator
MSTKSRSHLDKIIEALMNLNPTHPDAPIDAKTIAARVNLSPRQVWRGLYLLCKTGFLEKVRILNRYAIYNRTFTPLPHNRGTGQYYTPSSKGIARAVSDAVIAVPRKKLRSRAPSPKPGNISRQLTPFKND